VVAKLWLRHKFGDYLSFCYGKYDWNLIETDADVYEKL